MRIIVVLFGIGLLSTTGCAFMGSGWGGPGVTGAAPGSIFTQASYPGAMSPSTVQYNRSPGEYEIIGEVSGEAETTSYLGVYTAGDSGFMKMFEKAKEMGADDVINIKIDTEYNNILSFYVNVKSRMVGTAIKWK